MQTELLAYPDFPVVLDRSGVQGNTLEGLRHVLRLKERERREGRDQVLFAVVQGLRNRVDDVVGHFGVGDQHHVEGDQVGRLRDPVERGVRRDLHHVGARQKRLCALQRLGRSADFQDAQSSDRSEEHTSELQSPCNLVCRLLLEKKKGSTPGTVTPWFGVSDTKLCSPGICSIVMSLNPQSPATPSTDCAISTYRNT